MEALEKLRTGLSGNSELLGLLDLVSDLLKQKWVCARLYESMSGPLRTVGALACTHCSASALAHTVLHLHCSKVSLHHPAAPPGTAPAKT